MVENTGRNVDYIYDDVYRLVEEDITDLINGSENIAYTYDAFGNRLTKTDSAGTVIYTYDDNDRLVLEDGPGYTYDYIYDDNGNTIDKSDGTLTTDYAYDYENRLILVDTDTSDIAYTYDADGIRASSNVDGEVTYYLVDKNRDYAQVLEERDDVGDVIVEYVYGDDLISQERSGADSYYLYDGQMSTRALTDTTEKVIDEYIYDAFGSLTHQTGSTENNYLYTGEQYDTNAGFYYLRARYYNQATGRFITTDPSVGNIFEPITLHKYLYTSNNPVNMIDPTGLFSLREQLEVVTISSILANTAISLTAFHTIAESGFKIDAILVSGRVDISYHGPMGGVGADILFYKNNIYISFVGEFGLDPLSVFRRHRRPGFSVVAGLVFNLSDPNQLSQLGFSAFWPTSVMKLMPLIGGKSNVWGTMCQFANNVIQHKGAVVGFGKSRSGPASMFFGTSYRMFSTAVSYNSNFIPAEKVPSQIVDYVNELSGIANSLSTLGDDMASFSRNADQALSILQN